MLQAKNQPRTLPHVHRPLDVVYIREEPLVFDTLGWFAPAWVLTKILLLYIWLKGIRWDDELPPDVYDSWLQLRSELQNLSQAKTKVVSQKLIALPRLELCESYILALLMNKILNIRSKTSKWRLIPIPKSPCVRPTNIHRQSHHGHTRHCTDCSMGSCQIGRQPGRLCIRERKLITDKSIGVWSVFRRCVCMKPLVMTLIFTVML